MKIEVSEKNGVRARLRFCGSASELIADLYHRVAIGVREPHWHVHKGRNSQEPCRSKVIGLSQYFKRGEESSYRNQVKLNKQVKPNQTKPHLVHQTNTRNLTPQSTKQSSHSACPTKLVVSGTQASRQDFNQEIRQGCTSYPTPVDKTVSRRNNNNNNEEERRNEGRNERTNEGTNERNNER